MCGIIKLDRIRNERIRAATGVREISNKVRLRIKYMGKSVMVIDVPGKRRKGNPKRRTTSSTI